MYAILVIYSFKTPFICSLNFSLIAGVVRTFDWGSYLAGSHEDGASVSCFRHVSNSLVF